MPVLAYKYAEILGTLAMSVVLLRAIPSSAGTASVLWMAICYLVSFAAAGLVLGWIADAIVVGAVRVQFDEQLRKHTDGVAMDAKPTAPGGSSG